MTYIEYSTSAGHGTLVEHGVAMQPRLSCAGKVVNIDRPATFGSILANECEITAKRYSEFISIHGGERAI